MKSERVAARPGGFYVTIATAAGSTTKKVEGDLLTVGRAEDCHLTISHETLSRRHLSVTLKDSTCWIEDHGSSNGTYVNGKRIKPHVVTRVLPEDVITMGQAGVRLSVSAEPVMRKEGAPPVPADENTATTGAQTSDTIVTSTSFHRREQRKSSPAPAPKPKDEAQMQAEGLVQEAQKKAANMIQEAEVEAERRVEDIYRRAHETQAKMDEVYQRRMNEAYRAAEQLYQKSQEESQGILDNARQRSAEIRKQAESFVSELRQRTEEDCERMLEEAQQTARDLKEQRLLEADDIIKKKEEDLLAQAKAAMAERLARLEEDVAKDAERQRQALESEFSERRSRFEAEFRDSSAELEALKIEIEQLRVLKSGAETTLGEVERELKTQQDLAAEMKVEVENGRASVQSCNHELTQIRSEIDKSVKEKESAEKQQKSAVEALAKYNEEIKSSQNRVKQAHDDAASHLLQIRTRLEEEKAKLAKQEQAHLEELKLQTTRKIRELETHLLDELHDKKERMSREIALSVETYLKDNPVEKLRHIKPLQEEIASLLNKQVVTLSKDEGAKAKQASLVDLKRRQKIVTAMMGAVLGVFLALGSEHVLKIVHSDLSPMQRQVAAVQEERKQDLEKRKFSPPQTAGFKDTYLDNVVYTEEFVPIYTSDDFQNKFMKSLTSYMLKTWKLDEEKTIELIGIASSLVKVLAEKRQNIHPDFVSQALEKMRQDESESVERMRALLGSQVRLESFKKFEKQFYEGYHAPTP